MPTPLEAIADLFRACQPLPSVVTAGQPTERHLEALKEAGVEIVVDLRDREDPMAYVRNSPVFFADRIQTPLLLVHSDVDRFPLGQSEEIFSALYRLRKPATYVTYWGEGHGPASPANIRDLWQRIFAWFDTHLAPRGADPGRLPTN